MICILGTFGMQPEQPSHSVSSMYGRLMNSVDISSFLEETVSMSL